MYFYFVAVLKYIFQVSVIYFGKLLLQNIPKYDIVLFTWLHFIKTYNFLLFQTAEIDTRSGMWCRIHKQADYIRWTCSQIWNQFKFTNQMLHKQIGLIQFVN